MSARRRQNGPRCVWTDADDAKLVQKLRECKDLGMQSDSGWKPAVWSACAEVLKDSQGAEKTAEKCQDHYTNLKGAFNAVRKLRGLSGFGWDDGLKMVTASDEVWELYLATHENARKWRKTRFPLYDDILIIVDGIVATGAGAFHAGVSQSQPSTALQGTSAPATQTASSQAVDDVDGAANTSIETLVDDRDNDLTPSSPVHTPAPNPSRKRPASTPSSPNNGPRSRRKRNAEAASEIAAALHGVAQSLNVVGSPQVRDRAIKMMEEDEDFSESEEPLVMRLFTRDIAIAQTYIAATKKSRRTAFIRSLLEETVL